jgi:hypothetical protein
MLVHTCNLNIECPRGCYILEFVDLLLSEIQVENITLLNKNKKNTQIRLYTGLISSI